MPMVAISTAKSFHFCLPGLPYYFPKSMHGFYPTPSGFPAHQNQYQLFTISPQGAGAGGLEEELREGTFQLWVGRD